MGIMLTIMTTGGTGKRCAELSSAAAFASICVTAPIRKHAKNGGN